MHDSQLLEDYVTRNSEPAFQSLVTRYVNLVRSTALRQVRDATLGEEVTQAVFILLARKAARLRKTKNLLLGGWLYRTTRFVAARALRGELRRQRREQEAFQMQQFSAADETWRRIAPLLDEGIEQLDQTDRHAVILRFFQDEPLREVGGALGISEEAARKRVNRSLEKLRAFFTRRGFTISSAALLTTLAGQKSEAAPSELAAAIGAKALAHAGASTAALPMLVAETLQAWHWMAVRNVAGLGAAIGAAALLVTGAWTTWVHPHAYPAMGQSAPLQAAAAISPPTNSSRPAAETGVVGPWHFTLQVLDAVTGKGISNATVMADSWLNNEQTQSALHTDSQGGCDIQSPSANPAAIRAAVWADGYEARTVFKGLQAPSRDGYVLRLRCGSTIGGIVVDDAGRPVAGAGVRVSIYNAFDSSANGWDEARGTFSENLNSATTDSSGHWIFRSAPTNGDFWIIVAHPDFPPAGFSNDHHEQIAHPGILLKLDDLHAGKAILTLKSGLDLPGLVTDEFGYALEGAKVRPGQISPWIHSVSTEADGSFVLRALPAGLNCVTVSAEGFAPRQIDVRLATNTAPLAVKLKAGAVLRVQVVDQAGAPLPGARLVLEGCWPNTLEWEGWTDQAGRIFWNSAPIEPITFTVLKDGYFHSCHNILTADGEEHTFTLRPQLTVSGRVIDAETKLPISSFKATAYDQNGTVRGTNGQYRLPFTEFKLPLMVQIEADGYKSAFSRFLDASATNLTVDFALTNTESGKPIHGLVLLPNGSPAAGVQVGLSSSQRLIELGRACFVKNDSFATETDSDGRFSIAAEPAVRAVVAVCPEGVGSVAPQSDDGLLTVRLSPWGRIEGALKLRTRASNAGQDIILAGLFVQERPFSLNYDAYKIKTDADGGFVFDQVPPGNFTLFVGSEAGGQFTHRTAIQIQPGATTNVQIEGNGILLTGRLVFSDQTQDIDWAKQQLILRTKIPYPSELSSQARSVWEKTYFDSEAGQSSRMEAAQVQPDGSFTFEDVLPADYVLSSLIRYTVVDLYTGAADRSLGSFKQDVTVPQPADGQSVERIDLGAVTVQAK
jgi:RNA polymerase sigma factor (sigma-70 family)